jgi:hypothetical protein
MAQKIKYTSDGKKVIIVGKLNSQETIVQEIFIINDCEVPSGENFVVKSLHDAPAKSWEQMQIEKYQKEYEEKRKEYEKRLTDLRTKFRKDEKLLENKLQYNGKLMKNLVPESFDLLVNYLTGKIKFIVEKSYDPQILTIEEFSENYEDRLRLISFYGNDDGTMTYAIGQYCDSSGSHKSFYPFRTYEEALEKITKIILSEEKYDSYDIKAAEKYGIKLDPEKVEAYKKGVIEDLTSYIELYNKSIEKWKSDIEETKFIK